MRQFLTSAPKTCLPLKKKLSLALHTVLVLVLPILLIMHRLKMNAFVFKLGSEIEVRFPVPELDAQAPELDAKISLPSWAPMVEVMSKASGTAEAESSLS